MPARVDPLTSSGAPAPGWSLGADVDDAVAPVWRRLVALLVDQALAVLVGSAGLLAVLPALRSDGSVGALLVPGLLLLLLAAGQWFAEAFGGRTVGGALLGTRTVSARTGRAPGLWAVLVRSVVQALGLLLGGIGVYVVAGSGAWDEGPEQRGWHDKAAGTLVLRARAPRREEPGPSAPPAPAPAPAPVARPAGPTSGPPRPATSAESPAPPAPRP
ncbi:RDD family protein, partial [Cellulomonas sp. IC4_254]|uniref:RDD family protein n=1 Tax=Cellulomonas sp. IC4_254 TaxID=2714040 RepID=UPI001420A693|nr:RDD family protein [Cellulomonas sp. IC4_254]